MQPNAPLQGVMNREEFAVEANQTQAPVALGLEELYRAYGEMVYRLALIRTRNKADAEDVLQDVFFRCLRRQPDFRDREHQKAWLITAALNSTKSLLTTAARRHETGPEALDNRSTEAELLSPVYEAVLRLPEKYRTAVHLFYYEGYSVEEIGKLTGTKASTVKSHLHRAREALRRELKEENGDV